MFSKINIKKKQKRLLNNIGEIFYHFDYNHEELIYKYVCYSQLKKKELKKINYNERFDHIYNGNNMFLINIKIFIKVN